MIEPPTLTQTGSRPTATIRFFIPRHEIQQVMGPAIGEVIAAVTAQGIGPAGPVFSRHFNMEPETFDFEVGVPVTGPVTPTGRVMASELPAAPLAARTVYHGPYEGLGEGWGELMEWIQTSGHEYEPGLWEHYVTGPESGPDPAGWRTELVKPLIR